jgi:hypothetical protein
MRRATHLLLLSIPFFCQAQSNVNRSELANILNFEAEQTGHTPHGWGGGPPETIFTDDKVVHGGKWAVRLQRDAASVATSQRSPSAFPLISRELRSSSAAL